MLDEWGVEIYRLDMGVPELRYAAEYDGRAWHSSPDQAAAIFRAGLARAARRTRWAG